MHTSLRSRRAQDTLLIARKYAKRYGISRVTNTTWLDEIGMPVYASIRPDADDNSLCVCAGKGVMPVEAEVGAYMEAIEFALTEERFSNLTKTAGTVADVLDGNDRPDAILDFCPRLGAEIDIDESIELVACPDLITGKNYRVPAELVFLPYKGDSKFPRYFGSHTNGLASGNNFEEAVIHGVLEVVERDILSFGRFIRGKYTVKLDTIPSYLQPVIDKIEAAGLLLSVSYVESEWELPFFNATLIDKNVINPLYINGGYGCHFSKEIALSRAITEAVQSRMTFIHGGRDDVIDDHDAMEADSDDEILHRHNHSISHYEGQGNTDFSDIVDLGWSCDSVYEYLDLLTAHLKSKGIDHLLAARHTTEADEIQVVKVIIPTMEFFTKVNSRVGKRLRDFVQSMTQS